MFYQYKTIIKINIDNLKGLNVYIIPKFIKNPLNVCCSRKQKTLLLIMFSKYD